jgi:malonyl CoA-acyl carrier protein transacylase
MEGVVEIANVNSDKQVVISGEKEAVSKAATMCRSQGVCRRSVSLRIFILT